MSEQLATEMEAMLRRVTDSYEGLVRSDYEGSRGQIIGGMPGPIVEARALLARLDAAKAKPTGTR
jgi:hypothetical protein